MCHNITMLAMRYIFRREKYRVASSARRYVIKITPRQGQDKVQRGGRRGIPHCLREKSPRCAASSQNAESNNFLGSSSSSSSSSPSLGTTHFPIFLCPNYRQNVFTALIAIITPHVLATHVYSFRVIPQRHILFYPYTYTISTIKLLLLFPLLSLPLLY